ncbi:MAG: 4-hydroxy-tetrahydrodipicolinate synthase [Chloroflexi bacterium RBG_16_68_14]|nr:MAG: 4-hydroxy-tetrahydrodipicolinate synthase [Chloroflexi bacterium RBG_16_68_14]
MPELGRLLTAMVTPFAPDGSVDYDAAKRLALALLDSGSDGMVVAGTTGEAPTLSHEERLRLFVEVKGAVGDRAAIIANTGTYNTAESIELTREAERTGVDGVLLVTPYYNRPTQEGLERHFKAIAAATRLPCILYNLPGRTGVNMTAETTVRLSAVENIVGIKEGSGDLGQIARIIEGSAEGFRVWSGADEDTLPILAVGGYGVIAVVSHLVGRQFRAMFDDFLAGRVEEASRTHRRLLPLMRTMVLVTNPIPVKYALGQLGFPVGGLRLPLCEPDEATGERIMAEVRRHRIDLPVAV